MEDILKINNTNDYARSIGAPVFHPYVSVIHYDEMGEIPHSLCRFNVYGFFIQSNFPTDLKYGVGQYNVDGNSLLAYAPGQIGGKADDGTVAQYSGWVLLFSPDFVYGTPFEQKLRTYHFFSYNANEGLRLEDDEMALLGHIVDAVRGELIARKPHMETVVQDYILLLADLCNRYYERQFQKDNNIKNDILTRLQDVLEKYYQEEKYVRLGIPSVKYCADQLFISPSYLGDILRKVLGQSPLHYIRTFMIDRAKMLIASGKNMSEVSAMLGFDYPQHFTRVFKKETGMLPSKYLESLKK